MTLNILIVDDKPQTYKEFIDRVADIGIPREHIDVAQCGLEGLGKLESKRYDLVILDIAIPFRPEDEVNPQGALEVLDVITELEYQRKPSYILCITAYDQLPDGVEDRLDEHLIYLIKSSSSNSSWVGNLIRFVEQIQTAKAQEQTVGFLADVCIITALRDPEFKAIRALPWHWSSPKILNEVMSYIDGSFISGGKSYQAVASTCARMGMVETTLVAERLIQKFRPRLLILSGICAGYPDETQIGDVICGSPAWNWQSVKRISKASGKVEVQPDPDFIDIDERLRPFLDEVRDDSAALARIKEGWPADRPPTQLQLHVGPMASGSTVVADNSFEEIRKTQKRKTIGLEMEAYALYAVARSTPVARPFVLSIKSVCDHANYLKNDKYQSYAAYTSARVSALFCERYYERVLQMLR